MLLILTEADSKKSVALNPDKIVSVFTLEKAETQEMERFLGKTAVVLINGNIIVEEDYLTVVGRINSELL